MTRTMSVSETRIDSPRRGVWTPSSPQRVRPETGVVSPVKTVIRGMVLITLYLLVSAGPLSFMFIGSDQAKRGTDQDGALVFEKNEKDVVHTQ